MNLTLDAKDGILVNDQFGFTFDKSTTYGNSKRIEQEEDAEEFYRQSCVLDIGEKANEELNKQNKAREARDLSNDAEFDGFPVGQSENEDRIIFNIKLLKEGPQLWITKSKGLEKGIVVKSRADKEVEFEEVSWDDRQWLVAGYDLEFANGGQDKSKLEIVTTIEITDESQAAIYEYNFQDCVDRQAKHEEVNTNIDINGKLTEKNAHSFLSAGQIPLPEAYFFMFILFAGATFIWFSVVLNSSDKAFKLHWLMGALISVKSVSLLAHAMDFFYIGKDGMQHGWAVIFYMMYLVRGVLLFFTLALIATGYSFVKSVLNDKEKKVFMIVLPLQVIANVAYIILESTEESGANYQTWQEIAIFVDLVCCGAIMFPIVWSIRHLSMTTGVEGKGQMALKKLRLFRRFYTWTIAYIYLTRIGGLLLQMALPFQLEWLGEIVKETTTFIYFTFTGYTFRPGAEKNPYLQLKQNDEESSNLLEESGVISNMTRRKVTRKLDDNDSSDVDTDEDDLVDTVALIRAARSPTSVV